MIASPAASRYWTVEESEQDRLRDQQPLTRSVRSLLRRAIALLEIGVRRSFKIQSEFQLFKFQCEDRDEQIDSYAHQADLLRASDPDSIALQSVETLIRKIRSQQTQETSRLTRTLHKKARAELAESALIAPQLQSVVGLPESDLRDVALQSLLVARRAVQSVDDLMVSQKLEWRHTLQQKAISKWMQQAQENSSELVHDLQSLQVQRQSLIYHALLCADVELVHKLCVVDPTADINQTMELVSSPPMAAPIRSHYRSPHRADAALGSVTLIAASVRPSALSALACDDTRLWDATPVLTLISAGLDPTLPHPHLPHSSAIQVARAHLLSTGVSSADFSQGEQKETDGLQRSRVPPPPSHAVQTSAQARLVQLHQLRTFLTELSDRWTTHSSAVIQAYALCESSMYPQESAEVRTKIAAVVAGYLDLQT